MVDAGQTSLARPNKDARSELPLRPGGEYGPVTKIRSELWIENRIPRTARFGLHNV